MCLECLNDMQSLQDHLDLIDHTDLGRYPDISGMLSDQVLNDTIFINLLRDRRKRLSPAQRNRYSTISTNGVNWLYPFSIEKSYQKWISSKISEYIDIALPFVRLKMEDWVKEYDQVNTVQLDAYEDDIRILLEALRNRQTEMFDGESISSEISRFAENTSVQNQAQFEKFQQVAIGTTFQPEEPWVRGTVRTWVSNNRALLRGLTDEYIKKLEFEVVTGFQDGLASSSIIKNIKKMGLNLSGARANLIGRDQIGKLNGIYSKNRMQQSGLTMYVWLTALDERVRETHRTMENTVNRWEDASVVSRDNGKSFIKRSSVMMGAIPGSQIQCRCTSKPFFDELVGNIDKELQE